MQTQEPYVSVVIPCYNEERNLKRGVLEEVRLYLAQQDYSWEVIVVDDESTDSSKRLVEDFVRDAGNFASFDIPHGGKPAAVWAGIQRAVRAVTPCSLPTWINPLPSVNGTSSSRGTRWTPTW